MELINTCDQKNIIRMEEVTGNRRSNIRRLINKYNIEISKQEGFFQSSDRYKMKKKGETNAFQGVVQDALYEVFTVIDLKEDEIFEVWRSIEKDDNGHKWTIGKRSLGDEHDR